MLAPDVESRSHAVSNRHTKYVGSELLRSILNATEFESNYFFYFLNKSSSADFARASSAVSFAT